MNIKDTIKEKASSYASDIIAIRRHLHANPELSFEEYNTSEFVYKKLIELGLKPQKGIGGTGIVALVKGNNPDKKVIALRADMDALPIIEQNEVPYKSTNPGIMHACGHDVHTSSLLGAARILNEIKDSFDGTIKLIFQPGEEKIPGGASLMVPSPDNLILSAVTHDIIRFWDMESFKMITEVEYDGYFEADPFATAPLAGDFSSDNKYFAIVSCRYYAPPCLNSVASIYTRQAPSERPMHTELPVQVQTRLLFAFQTLPNLLSLHIHSRSTENVAQACQGLY